MDLLVIEKDDFGEQHRLPVSCLSLPLFVHIEEGNAAHLLKAFRAQSQSHGHKWIVTSGGTDCIELILNSLPSLIKITLYFIVGILLGFIPVSYTHLDVYKRQSWIRPGRIVEMRLISSSVNKSAAISKWKFVTPLSWSLRYVQIAMACSFLQLNVRSTNLTLSLIHI